MAVRGLPKRRERVRVLPVAEDDRGIARGLYTHVWKLDVLREAYRLAKQNNGAPGVDGVTFEQVEREGVEPLLESLSRELRDKSYEPLPSRQ